MNRKYIPVFASALKLNHNMPLTEAQKRKIEEEEKYKTEIRKEFKEEKKKKGIGCFSVIGIIVGFIMLASFIATFNFSPQSNLSSQNSEGTIETHDSNISIAYSIKDGEKRYIATFKENLPRDDATVGENIGKIIRYAYGADTITDPTPKIVNRNGVNLISLEAKDGKTFLVLLMKNDNGTVYGMNFWKE